MIGLDKVFSNAKWILGCKIAQSLIQLVIGMISARYLGPSNYGLVNYAASLVAFGLPVMQLGLQSTLVQEYVDTPEREGEIMGTSLAMNLASAITCMIGIIAFSAVANCGEPVTIMVCALYSVTLLSQAFEMLQYWFQAKLLSKYSSVAMLTAYIVVSVYKIYLLASGKSVYWFALSHAVEYGVVGALLIISYNRQGMQRMCVSFSLAKELFAKSKHYIAAMLMVTVYNSIGTVLLKLFVDEAASGYFSAAVICTGITNFVFTAVIDTARPVILESKKQSYVAFEKNVARAYAIIIWLSIAQSVFFTLFAKYVIYFLYGEEFMAAVPVLQIMIWNSAFSYMGYIRNIWILAEEKHRVLFTINASGALFGVLTNALFIPLWGACGAAFASVLVQIFTNFVMGFILKPIRLNNKLLLKGFNPRLIVELFAIIMNTIKAQNADN